MPIHPAAQVLEAGPGAEGERDPGDEKQLRVAEQLLEAAEISRLQEGARGGLARQYEKPGPPAGPRGSP